MYEYKIAAYTDIGIKRRTNQDSIYASVADTDAGTIAIAAICDGMGGLSDGEMASAKMTYALEHWFEEKLPEFLARRQRFLNLPEFKNTISGIVNEAAEEIKAAAVKDSGTTMTLLLMAGGIYYTVNVGDSRIYHMQGEEISQITKDQTVVQMELDAGRITMEEAKTHPQRNVLLQCVGATEGRLIPEFTQGTYKSTDAFLLCSDGFRHCLEENEMLVEERKEMTEKQLTDRLCKLTYRCMQRGEKDNISSILIYAEDADRF